MTASPVGRGGHEDNCYRKSDRVVAPMRIDRGMCCLNITEE
jgi:hypothetical protein